MKYAPAHHTDIIAVITCGSRLYGTATIDSDYDFKVVTLPSKRSLLLAEPLKVQRYKFYEDGTPVSAAAPMPHRGYEAEHTPVQKFVSDYLGGQTYAVEMVCAVLAGYHLEHLPEIGSPAYCRARAFETLCQTLAADFQHQNVNVMVGFAIKQTFDYVRRGERLTAARAVLATVDEILFKHAQPLRLDTQTANNETLLDYLARVCNLKIGKTVNANKELRTLELNGRSYAETTAVLHFKDAVQKLIAQYGERSAAASEAAVDWKSLSHAVRVYEQVLELLATGRIIFPRSNAAEILRIKQGLVPIAEVKEYLHSLDDKVIAAIATSTLPKVDDAMKMRADDLLYSWLNQQY